MNVNTAYPFSLVDVLLRLCFLYIGETSIVMITIISDVQANCLQLTYMYTCLYNIHVFNVPTNNW